MHTVGLTQPDPSSHRICDPSATLTWFSKLAKASIQGVAAVACVTYGEPQMRAECLVADELSYEEKMASPLPKVLTTL